MIHIESFNDGGRLGNSLFRLAAAIGLANKHSDTVYYPDFLYAKYFEGDFTNSDQFIPPSVDFVYREPEFAYNEIPYQKNMALSGYYQSYRYFEHCKKLIKSMFKIKHISDYHIEPHSVAVHIRRGDYVYLQEHHPLQTWDNYYKKAYERIESYYPARWYVFSDGDVESEFPKNENFEYVRGLSDIEDMYLISKCQYKIISNSSFSWWASYLSEEKNSQTVAPLSNWFGPKLNFHDTKDLCPKDWIVY